MSLADEPLELLDRIDDAKLERIARIPHDVGRPADLEYLGPIAAELRIQLELVDGNALGLRRIADQAGAADLPRPDNLEIVDEEDGNAGGIDQLFDLGDAGEAGRRGEPIVAEWPQTMGFVQDERVESVALRGRVVVEELELNAGARADDLSHVSRERPRARGVVGIEALARERADKVERDDALAGPWAATHQDDGLLLVLEALRDLAQHGIEYDELLV